MPSIDSKRRTDGGQTKLGGGGQFSADFAGKRGDLNQIGDLLVVERTVNLRRAIGWLARWQDLLQLAKFHSYKSLRHLS